MKFVALFFRLVKYFCFFLYELVAANIVVAKMVLSPKFYFKSAAVHYVSKMKNKAELILITNSITLTPGTLVMDADLKNGHVWVHVMSADTLERVKRNLLIFPEGKVLEAVRRHR